MSTLVRNIECRCGNWKTAHNDNNYTAKAQNTFLKTPK